MPQIIVNDQQAKLILEAREAIAIFDQQGRQLGYVGHGFTQEDVAIAQHRLNSNEPRYTTQQVLDHLRSLEGQ